MVVYPIDVDIFARDYNFGFEGERSLDYSWHLERKKPEPAGHIRSPGPVRAVVINTCPRKEAGGVAALLDPFLGGMKEAGAEVELHYARDLTIFPCCGNLNCTIRTPGNCMAYDDMRWLRQDIGMADILVLASPLYFDGRVGPGGATPSLKSLLRRLTPGKRPPAGTPYEHAVHTTWKAVNLRKVVFASGCGFWEIEDFYPVLTHVKALCHNTFPDFAGNIVGDYGVLLRGALEDGTSGNDVREISRKAGIELAGDGKAPGKALESRTRDMHGRVIGREEPSA